VNPTAAYLFRVRHVVVVVRRRGTLNVSRIEGDR